MPQAKGFKGIAPQEFGAVWNPWAALHREKKGVAYDFVTFGQKHIVFWNFEPGGE